MAQCVYKAYFVWVAQVFADTMFVDTMFTGGLRSAWLIVHVECGGTGSRIHVKGTKLTKTSKKE